MTCIQLKNHQHLQDNKHIHHPQKSVYKPFKSLLFLTVFPHLQGTTGLFSVTID